MPKQMPKNGTWRSRAKRTASILPSRAALAEAAGHQDAVHALQPRHRVGLLEDLAVHPVELARARGWRCRHAPAPRRAICSCRAGWCICRRRRCAPRPPARAPRRRCAASATDPARCRAAGRNGAAPRGPCPRRDSASARRRSCRRRAPRSPPPGRTLQNSAILRRSLSGIGRSQRHSSMFGWMPTFSSSFTECCVGLVFSSPAERIYGTSVRCTNIARSRPQLVAELADRLQERQALDVADRAADLDQHEIRGRPCASSASRVIASLIASVMCGITCTVAPR